MRALIVAVLLGVCMSAYAEDPASLVKAFYERYPNELEGGLPRDEDLEWLSGWISTELYDRFRSTLAYQEQWMREHRHGPYILKPPFADGVEFTGVPDMISGFEVGVAQRVDDSWQVPIHFCIGPEFGWDALAIVKQERGRYVLDDIAFFPTDASEHSWRFSEALDSRE